MSATTDRVSAVVAPVAQRLGLSVYDIDQPGGTLRVMLDAEGGVDLETLTEASREISAALDDAQPMAGAYTLEVSSPGLERPLRRGEHFLAAIGERIKVKLMPGVEGDRRAEGELVGFDDDLVTIATEAGERTVRLEDISKARTVFEWSPPAKGESRGDKSRGSRAEGSRAKGSRAKGSAGGKKAETANVGASAPDADPGRAEQRSTTESTTESSEESQ